MVTLGVNGVELMLSLCVCGSKKAALRCCRVFLDQGKRAKTPVQLMRSRYSAFALGGYGEYLIQTWHPKSAAGLNAAALSIRSTNWVGLEIVEKSQNGDHGMVEFKARYLDQSGQQCIHHERSLFERLKGNWLYVTGQILEQ